MISAWQVYLVLQLDRFIDFCSMISFVAGMLGLLILAIAAMSTGCGTHAGISSSRLEQSQKMWASSKRFVGWMAAIMFVLGFVSTALPSTKTMAAMIILPAITSDQVVQPLAKEGKELYSLAKEALRKAVQDDAISTTTATKETK